MASYELMLLLRVEVEGREKELLAEIEKLIEGVGGKVDSSQIIGRKPLAYPIQKQKEGIYILFNFGGGKVKDLDKKLKIKEDVLRYLIVKRKI